MKPRAYCHSLLENTILKLESVKPSRWNPLPRTWTLLKLITMAKAIGKMVTAATMKSAGLANSQPRRAVDRRYDRGERSVLTAVRLIDVISSLATTDSLPR